MSEFDSGSGRKGFVHDVMRRISSASPRGGDAPDAPDAPDALGISGTNSNDVGVASGPKAPMPPMPSTTPQQSTSVDKNRPRWRARV